MVVFSPTDARIPICSRGAELAAGVLLLLNPLNATPANLQCLQAIRPKAFLYHRRLEKNPAALRDGASRLAGVQFLCVNEWIDDAGSADSMLRQPLPSYEPGWCDTSDNAPGALWETGGTSGAARAVLVTRLVAETP